MECGVVVVVDFGNVGTPTGRCVGEHLTGGVFRFLAGVVRDAFAVYLGTEQAGFPARVGWLVLGLLRTPPIPEAAADAHMSSVCRSPSEGIGAS